MKVQELSKLKTRTERVPKHIAIIPDGNRRWAREKGREGTFGHERAVTNKNLSIILKETKNLGVEYLSLWGFSTENWKRGKEELIFLFNLLYKVVLSFRKDFHENRIRFRHFGRKDRLPKKLIGELNKLEEETKNYTEFNVHLCLDYGGRDEILRCVNKILKEGKKEVTAEEFSSYLDTKEVPDPELIIRTSGEKRLSGFMPFQASYAEFEFLDKHFPDFAIEDLKKCIENFSARKRRFGGD